jgi:hypothetical protein
VRRGYRFDLVNVTPPSIEAALEALANQVWQFVANEASNGKRYTKPELEKMLPVLNMKRDDLRCAVQMLLTNGRLEEMVASTPGRRGAPSRYLHAVDLANLSPSEAGEQMEFGS